MSVGKTAASIGIRFTADPKQAEKAIADLDKQLRALGLNTSKADLLRGAANNGLDGLERLTLGLGRATVGAVKLGLGIGAVGATAAAVGLLAMATSLGSTGAAASRAADRLGMPVERLSELRIAAHLAGSSADDMTNSLITLQGTVSDAAYGRNNGAWSAFHAAGIDIGNAKDGAKDYAAILPKIADETQKLASIDPNAALRWLDMVGVSRELFPLLRKGSAGLKGWMDQAQQIGPLTRKEADEALALDEVMRTLGERFEKFERIGGAAIAPGLTKFLDMLQQFLQSHQGDVEAFFTSVEHGVEWLMTPKNLAWLRDELDSAVEGLKHLYEMAESLEHNAIIRRVLGLPAENNDPAVTFPDGIPFETSDQRASRLLNDKGRRGSDPTTDPQSLSYAPGAPQSASQKALAQTAMGVLVGKGWNPEDAAGIVGNLQQESTFNTMANNGSHAGIAQWDATRQAEIAAHFGKPVQQMSFREQLDAVNWELTQGRYKTVGDQLRNGPHEAGRAAALVDGGYEVPALAGTPQLRQEDFLRAANARRALSDYSPDDPATKRFLNDGQASNIPPASSNTPSSPAAVPSAGPTTPAYSTQQGNAGDSDGRLAKLLVELRHVNPPPGAELNVVNADPSQIDVTGVKVMGAMPNSGQQRNIARDGY